MLDLQAGVHLQEVEALVLAEQIRGCLLRRSSRRRRRANLAHAGAQVRIEGWRGASSMTFWLRRWTEQSRSNIWAIVAVAVAEDLDLDVARSDDGALDIDVSSPNAALASRRAPS